MPSGSQVTPWSLISSPFRGFLSLMSEQELKLTSETSDVSVECAIDSLAYKGLSATPSSTLSVILLLSLAEF